MTLTDAARMAGWPTPMAGNPGTETYNEAGNTDSSRKTVYLLTGSSAAMSAGGRLNPAHSRWLMRLPPAWDGCAVMATLSTPKSRRSS
jgi:hypothetical protein